jgi:hypothetical protein
MTSEANPHYFATTTKDDTSIDQITDSLDFPHTGLIKTLSLGMKGNYALKGSATDFDITQAGSGNVVQVAAGKIYRDNAFLAVAAKNFVAGDFQATSSTYHLLVADSASPPVLQIRKHGSSTQSKVPEYTEGDTIIAVLTYTSDGFNDMTVQYLTTGKVSNNVSIGYDSSGYTEAMSIEGNATRTLFKNKVADADIRFMLAADTADEKFEIYEDTGDSEVFSVTGAGVTAVKKLHLGTAGELTITESSDDISFTNTVNDKTLKFVVNDGGGNDKTAILTAATTGDVLQLKGIEETFIIAASDETTDLTTGDGKATFAAPFNFLITGVKASVTTTPAGSTLTVAIRRIRSGSAVDVLSTNITVDANEETSRTAATAPVINASNDDINIDDIIAIDIDQIGSSRAGKGLKITIFGYRT